MGEFWARHRFTRCAALLLRRYYDHHVGRDSAALTYYLLFSLFPLLIFLNNLVGLLPFDLNALLAALARVVPREVLELLAQYLLYVSRVSSPVLLWFSLVFMIYFPYRAVNALFRSVRKAYGASAPERPVRQQLRVLLYTLLFVVTIPVSIALSVISSRALAFVSRYIYLSETAIRLWSSLRFVLLGALLLGMIALLYTLAPDARSVRRGIWPGVFVSLTAWVGLSMLFSLYVEHAANYSVIYGSIGAIIVLLLWLSLSATMLIMGAEFNSVLLETRKA